jgi:CheY-like chemotaxis protein
MTKNNEVKKMAKKVLVVDDEKLIVKGIRFSLEQDGMIIRTVFPEVPVRVEYALSVLGNSLIPILHEINVWGTGFQAMTDIAK